MHSLQFVDSEIAHEYAALDGPAGLRLMVPTEKLDGVEPSILRDFQDFCARLRKVGVEIAESGLPDLVAVQDCVQRAQIVAFEAFKWHRDLLRQRKGLYDPRVAFRFDSAAHLSKDLYLQGLQHLKSLRRLIDLQLDGFDGLLLPTIPIRTPTLADVSDEDAYLKINAASFRNTSVANHLDLPSVCWPIAAKSGDGNARARSAMLIGERATDARTLAIACQLEAHSGV